MPWSSLLGVVSMHRNLLGAPMIGSFRAWKPPILMPERASEMQEMPLVAGFECIKLVLYGIRWRSNVSTNERQVWLELDQWEASLAVSGPMREEKTSYLVDGLTVSTPAVSPVVDVDHFVLRDLLALTNLEYPPQLRPSQHLVSLKYF